MTSPAEITPDDSSAPVFLDPTPRQPLAHVEDAFANAELVATARQAAVTKLLTLGLTEEEASALVGR